MNGCGLANRLWLLSQQGEAQRFAAALAEPERVQRDLLRWTLRRNADTDYGCRHGFAEIDDFETFQRRVPLVNYTDLAHDIDRIRCGEPNVLTAETVTRLVPTSGSTAGVKLIPWTAGLGRQFSAGIAPWVTDLFQQYPDVKNGPAYWSISPAIDVPTRSDDVVPIGFDDDTAYLGRWARRLVDRVVAVPSDVRRLREFADFQYATLWHLVRARRLRLVSVWHPSFWTLLVEALPKWWTRLSDDLSSGRCRLPSGERWGQRVRVVRGLEKIDPTQMTKVWPDLTVISAWGDGASTGPLQRFGESWPTVAVQAKGLISTEAFVSLPYRDEYPAAVRSHLIEWRTDSGECLPLWSAKVGQEYEPVVTTAGGLYRYRTGDRVMITGMMEATPTLRLLGRAGAVVDVCGEKLHEPPVIDAINAALRAAGIEAGFRLLAPHDSAPPTHYELFFHPLQDTITPSEIEKLTARLENHLSVNPHYAYARRVGQLNRVAAHPVAPDAERCYLERLLAEGQSLGGIKPAVLSRLSGWRHFLPIKRHTCV